MSKNDSRFLIIDDEPDFAEFVSDTLDALGYRSDVCNDATDLGITYSSKHALIFLDLFMPGLDGIEVLRFLRDNNSSVPLVIMSGNDASVLHSARELATEWKFPVLGTLQKPFSVGDLKDVVDKFVSLEAKKTPADKQSLTVADLENAIAAEQLTLVYQPQIRLSDRSVSGLEALIRWVHPQNGFISPKDFIPFAEENGLIDGINNLVVKTAIEQLGVWHRLGYAWTVSINLSPAAIADIDFPERLTELAVCNRVSASCIIIEVTETALMSDVGNYMDILTRLRMKGFGLSIDDFGTGYSSLHQMVRLPFTELKIDQAFVTKICEDFECETVTEIATTLAHRLGMTVVAEGVEDAAAMSKLEAIGCDQVQGYFCARPMLPDAFEKWLSESKYTPTLQSS